MLSKARLNGFRVPNAQLRCPLQMSGCVYPRELNPNQKTANRNRIDASLCDNVLLNHRYLVPLNTFPTPLHIVAQTHARRCIANPISSPTLSQASLKSATFMPDTIIALIFGIANITATLAPWQNRHRLQSLNSILKARGKHFRHYHSPKERVCFDMTGTGHE